MASSSSSSSTFPLPPNQSPSPSPSRKGKGKEPLFEVVIGVDRNRDRNRERGSREGSSSVVSRFDSRGVSEEGEGEDEREYDEDEDEDENDEQEEEEEEDEGERDEGEEGEREEEEDEPAELDENDLDPINSAMNSGPGTPSNTSAGGIGIGGIKLVRPGQFTKRKEIKVTIKNVIYSVIDDEIMLEDDPRGEAKIDSDGVLQGGRQFKLYTFSSPGRTSPSKQWMLSIDAARAAGFRDSLYFFRRNLTIHKLTCTQAEKDMLIDAGKLSSNLKSRAVTMVSARNVFKVMGAEFIVNGKYIFDDYYEDKSLEAGHKPGEIAYIETYDTGKGDTGTLASAKGSTPSGVPGKGLNSLLGSHSHKPPGGKQAPPIISYLKDEYISTGSSSGINHIMFANGNGLQPFAKSWDPVAKKARPAANLSVNNWMLEYAKNVGESNRKLAEIRMMNLGQVKVNSEEVEDDEEEQEQEEDEGEEADAGSDVDVDVGRNVGEDSIKQDTPFEGSVASQEASTSKMDLDSPSSITRDLPSTTNSSSTKKRKERRYNPLRGAHDPETNVPHVFHSTQPTKSSIIQIDTRPRLYDEEVVQGLDREGRIKRRKLERNSAVTLGLATVEYLVDGEDGLQEEPLLPGLFDFRPVELKAERW